MEENYIRLNHARHKVDSAKLEQHRKDIEDTYGEIIPICIVVDTSYSMFDKKFVDTNDMTRMDRLNDGMQKFIKSLKDNEDTADSVEISIVTYANDVHVFVPFTPLSKLRDFEIKQISGKEAGNTPLGVDKALEMLFEEKEFLKSEEVRRHVKRPWIAIFSDGKATISNFNNRTKEEKEELKNYIEEMQEKTSSLELNKELNVIPIIISEIDKHNYKACLQEMQGFSKKHNVVELINGADQFSDFFEQLYKSVSLGYDYFNKVKENKQLPNIEHKKIVNDSVSVKLSEVVDTPTTATMQNLKDIEVFNDEQYLQNINIPSVQNKTVTTTFNTMYRKVEHQSINIAEEDIAYDISEIDDTKEHIAQLLADISDWDNL